MYSQVPLSADDRQLLSSLRRAANLEIYLVAGVGIVLILLSCGIADIMMSENDPAAVGMLLTFFLVLFCVGLLLLYRSIRIYSKTKRQFGPIQNKRIISGILQQLETIDKKYLRYTIDGSSFLVYVPLPVYLAKTEYKRPFISAAALLNTNTSLHLVPIEPGVELLLQSHYKPSRHQATVRPLQEDDKQRQLDNFVTELKIIFAILAVMGVIAAMIAGFKKEVWLFIGLLFLLILIIIACVTLPRIIGIMRGSNKICITTTVTEKLEAMARSGKSMSKHTWYRLGNGTVEQHQLTTFRPGDTVLIEHLEKKNGGKGPLLDIKKI